MYELRERDRQRERERERGLCEVLYEKFRVEFEKSQIRPLPSLVWKLWDLWKVYNYYVYIHVFIIITKYWISSWLRNRIRGRILFH